jgi:PAS domain S-box-containing protein
MAVMWDDLLYLRRFIRLLGQGLELPSLMSMTLDHIAEVLQVPSAALVMWDDEADVYSVVSVLGLPSRCLDIRFSASSSIAQRLASQQVLDLEGNDPWIAQLSQDERDLLAALRGHIAIPMQTRGRLLGWFHLGEPSVDAMVEDELLQAMADLVGVALDAALVREQQRSDALALEILNRIGLNSTRMELDELLEQIYLEVAQLVDAPSFYIALYDEQEEEFSFAFYVKDGARHWPEEGTCWPLSEGLTSDIVRTKEPIVTQDYVAECERRGILPRSKRRGFPGMSWLGVPLLAGNRVIGVMCLSSPRSDTVYRLGHVRLLSTIAAQVAIVIERARIREREQQRVVELEALNKISRAIGSAIFLDELLRSICQGVQGVLDAPNFYIALYDDQEACFSYALCVEQNVEIEPAEPTWPLGIGLSSVLVRQKRPVVTEDYLSECEQRGIPPKGDPGKAWLGVPVASGEEILGVMVASSFDEQVAYTQADVRLLSTVASQAASAIEKARLYERTDAALARRVEELTAIEEIAREMNRVLDFQRVIEIMLERAMMATGASTGIISMLRPDEEGLFLICYRGSPDEVAEHYRTHPWDLEEGIIGRVVRTNQPALIDDVRNDPDYVDVIPTMRSGMAVPIQYGNRAIGVINLESTRLAAFDEEHLHFLQQLADQATIAIRNSRQYEEQVLQTQLLKQKTDQLTELLHLGNAMRVQLDLENVLQMVAEGVRRSLGFNLALLSLVDAEDPRYLRRVACAGLSQEVFEELKSVTVPREQYERIIQPEFQLGSAFFFDHRYTDFGAIWDSPAPTHRPELGERAEGEWHPDDAFMIPLVGTDEKLLGVLSVDDPVDRCLPTIEIAESLELFANQAVIAIESARLFYEVTEARDRLQAILDSTEDGIALLSEEGRVLLANPSIAQWTEYTQEGIAGKTLLDMILHVSRGNRKMRRTLIGEYRRTLSALRADPQSALQGDLEISLEVAHSFEWILLPVVDREGDRIGRILLLRDVTAARSAERMREDLVSMIVHDLRGPLTAFLGALDTLLRPEIGVLSDLQKTLVEVGQDGGRQMLDMVNTLLDIRRLEVGRMPLQYSSFQIEDTARRAISRLAMLIQEHQLNLRLTIESDLPEVRADEEKIVRVFENLIHNAIKFSYPGGLIEVKVGRHGDEGALLCAVVDHGVGIPKSEHARVFEKFSQVYHTGVPRGSGLGLAFCRLAVEAHGGRIWVESEEGKGTRFFFLLPFDEE